MVERGEMCGGMRGFVVVNGGFCGGIVSFSA